MTISTRLIGLIMTVAVFTGIAVAQGPPLPLPLPNDEGLPEMQLPSPPSSAPSATSAGTGAARPAEDTGFTPDSGYATPQVEGYELNNDGCDNGYDYGDAAGLWGQVAPIESTSTWLQRGFWYAETDAVVLNRMFKRDDMRLAAQDQNVDIPPIASSQTGQGVSLGFNPLFLNTNRILILNGSLPGEDASVRATLGKFLFRDSRNRDHTLEFTVYGGGEWDQQRQLSSETANGLFVPFFIDGGNRSFDASTRQTVDYKSNLDSFELNYRVKQRLGHDQLVMDPNGNWHRALNSGFERNYLFGMRFLELSDTLDWQATDILTNGVAQGNDGSYFIRTKNDLFGFQAGGGLTYQTPRWSVGTRVKGGIFVNDALGNTALNFTADDAADANLRLRENQLSFIGEFGLQAKYHVTPNVSVRAGYDMMLLTSIALAPDQATFITDFSYLNTTGDPFYHGASMGMEWYW